MSTCMLGNAPERELIIPREMDELHRIIKECDEVSHILHARLDPLLLSVVDKNDETKEASIMPAFANDIRRAFDAVLDIKHRLNDIISTLEL